MTTPWPVTRVAESILTFRPRTWAELVGQKRNNFRAMLRAVETGAMLEGGTR